MIAVSVEKRLVERRSEGQVSFTKMQHSKQLSAIGQKGKKQLFCLSAEILHGDKHEAAIVEHTSPT